MTLGVALLVFISILVFASGFISSTYELRNKQKHGFLKSLTSSGWLVIVFTVLILILTTAQFIYTEHKNTIENGIRDSVIRADYAAATLSLKRSYDSSSKNLIISFDTSTKGMKDRYDSSTTNIVRALAEYGLTYNQRSDRIEKLVNDTRSPEPDFNFCDVPIKVKDTTGDFIHVDFNFCSDKAASSDIDVVCYLVYHMINGAYLYGGQSIPLPKNTAIGAGKGYGAPMLLPKRVLFETKEIFILLKGTYKNKDGSKTFPINDIAGYDFINKKSGGATPYMDMKVREAIKEKGID